MAVPYLKSDTFGQDNYTVLSPGQSCPKGQVPAQVTSIFGESPTICESGETMDLSGQPLADVASPATPAAPSLAGLTDWLKQYGSVGYLVAGVVLVGLLSRR
jgi:hypothetical protein